MAIGHLLSPTKHVRSTLRHSRPYYSRLEGRTLLLPVSEKPEVLSSAEILAYRPLHRIRVP